MHFKMFRKQNYYKRSKVKGNKTHKPHYSHLSHIKTAEILSYKCLISSLKANRSFLAKPPTVLFEVVLSLYSVIYNLTFPL